MPAQDNVDTRALEKATEALVKIESYERVCSQRYAEIASGQKAIFRKLDEMDNKHFNRWLIVAGATIVILLAVIGSLYQNTGIVH